MSESGIVKRPDTGRRGLIVLPCKGIDGEKDRATMLETSALSGPSLGTHSPTWSLPSDECDR